MNNIEILHPTLQAQELHLFLFDRPLHPELFRHFANYRVAQGEYHADIWVVGLSHVVTVTRGNRTVTELVARDSEMLPTRGVLTRFRLKGERDHERELAEGGMYMVSSQVETMDDALYKSVHTYLRRGAEDRGWLVEYEQWADGGLAPFTHIEHEARDSEFHVYTFHAFPHERTLVKTQSIFELIDGDE